MKKVNLLIISLAGALSLCACGNNEKSKSSEFKPAPEKNETFKFNEIESTCLVNPKIKAYVDAMKEQEKTLPYPYRISSLYGPEDFGWQKADTKDGATYAPEETGGVDVCTMLNRKDYNDKNIPEDIVISWDKGNLEYEEATLKFSINEDMSEAREVKVTEGATQASLRNLYRNTYYYYQLDTGDYQSSVYRFLSDDYPRTINADKIYNFRDLGGYMTSYGVRTNQGLVYRGSEINSKTFGQHNKNVTDELLKVQDEVLHIGKEIDLRKDESSATDQTHECHLVGEAGSQEAKDAYECLTVIAYDSFVTSADSAKNYARIFELLANADNEHVFFHCWGGADRTGMVAFFLNAILGVSYTDCVIDFELTTECNNKRCHMHNSENAHFPKFLHAFTNYANYLPEATLNQNAVQFLTDKGVKMEHIERIREIFIPGYYEGMPEVEPEVPETVEAVYVPAEDIHVDYVHNPLNEECEHHHC